MPRRFNTPRLSARPIEAGDFKALAALHGDARAMATLGGVCGPARTRERLRTHMDHWERHGFGVWVLSDAAGFVGYAGLEAVQRPGREMELLCALSPTRWELGYGTEVLRSVTRIGLHELGLESILGRLVTESVRSCRIIEKIGYRYESYEVPRLVYRCRRTSLVGAVPSHALREAGSGDAELIRDLMRASFGGSLAPDREDDLADVDASYHARGGRFDVVERDEHLIGSVGLWPVDNDVCELRRLCAASEPGAEGLPRALLAHATRMASGLGFRRLTSRGQEIALEES